MLCNSTTVGAAPPAGGGVTSYAMATPSRVTVGIRVSGLRRIGRRQSQPEVQHQAGAFFRQQIRLPQVQAGADAAHLVLDGADVDRVAGVVIVQEKGLEP